jgi:hypothetical protein
MDWNIIEDAIWNIPTLFFPVTYPYRGGYKTITMYVGSIPTDLYRAGPIAGWAWKGVSFDLIQK